MGYAFQKNCTFPAQTVSDHAVFRPFGHVAVTQFAKMIPQPIEMAKTLAVRYTCPSVRHRVSFCDSSHGFPLCGTNPA